MQRRDFLKYVLPLGLATAGLAAGLTLFKKTACAALDLQALLKRLKPFSDDLLGKKISVEVEANDLKRFDGLCEANFDDGYRALVAKEFGERKIKNVEGWILSETEIITHRVVYSHQE